MGEHFQVMTKLNPYIIPTCVKYLVGFFFSRYDLYTKSSTVPDIDALWPYYQSLVDKYFGAIKLKF